MYQTSVQIFGYATTVLLMEIYFIIIIGINTHLQMKTKDQLDVTCYFYFTSYALNIFRKLIYPSSGAYDYSVELAHWSCVVGSMCVGVSVWLGWRCIRVRS